MHGTTYVPSFIFRGDRMDLAGVLLFRARLRLSEQRLAYRGEFKEFDAFRLYHVVFISTLHAYWNSPAAAANMLRKRSWKSTVA